MLMECFQSLSCQEVYFCLSALDCRWPMGFMAWCWWLAGERQGKPCRWLSRYSPDWAATISLDFSTWRWSRYQTMAISNWKAENSVTAQSMGLCVSGVPF
ncbi:hypothetical protein LEMLEM_LOCUS6805 [Lemmus lemmus]